MSILKALTASAIGALALFKLKRPQRPARIAAPFAPPVRSRAKHTSARHYIVKSCKRVQVAVPPMA
jgi:hypothetical protein